MVIRFPSVVSAEFWEFYKYQWVMFKLIESKLFVTWNQTQKRLNYTIIILGYCLQMVAEVLYEQRNRGC